MRFSDIQLEDKIIWNQIQEAWESGDYATAIALTNSSQIDNKVLKAKLLNDLTDKIVEVEQMNDPSYANDRIQVLRKPPEIIGVGEIYFEATNWPYTWADVDERNYKFENIDSLDITWKEADKGGW